MLTGDIMLKVSKSSYEKPASVRGTPAEMTLFYCIWQTHLWPNWLEYVKSGDPGGDAVRQHGRVVKAINDGHDLILFNTGKRFQDALDFTIERCRMLDVEVVLD